MNARAERSTVVLGLGFPEWEAEFLTGLAHPAAAVRVARRCVDVTDVVAYVSTTRVCAAVITAQLKGLDGHVVGRLREAAGLVIGLADSPAQRDQLASWGVADVLLVDANRVSAAVSAVVSAIRRFELEQAADNSIADPLAPEPGRKLGYLVEVAGPQGSVGRTTAAVAMADEAVRMGRRCLIVDADVHGASVDQMLGIADNDACVNAMLTQLAAGALDEDALWHSAVEVAPELRAITGPAGARCVRPELWQRFLALATKVADLVVVDRGCLQPDDFITGESADLAAADAVVLMGGSDPIAVARLLRCLHDVRQLLPVERLCTVVSRERADDREWHEFLVRRLGQKVRDCVVPPRFIAEDATACSLALKQGQTLAQVAPRSKARRDLIALTDHVLTVARAA